ncbi:unknown [Akkermansia sp. CAG:344]|nr:unknown [Akkermansia sp. CAG:344]
MTDPNKFGAMWRNRIFMCPMPRERAASTNSCPFSSSVCVRTMRASVSQPSAPMAMKRGINPVMGLTISTDQPVTPETHCVSCWAGSSTDREKIITSTMNGRAKSTSTRRIIRASSLPPA